MYPTRDALNIVLSYLTSKTTSCALLGDHPIMCMLSERMTLDMAASLPGTFTFCSCTCTQTASACTLQEDTRTTLFQALPSEACPFKSIHEGCTMESWTHTHPKRF